MTGYAVATGDGPYGRLSVELRSVNSRFLDLSFRIVDDARLAEPSLRDALTGALQRGKVECRVSLQRVPATTGGGSEPTDGATTAPIDHGLLARLLAVRNELRQRVPQAADLTVADLMRFPGLVMDTPIDADRLVGDVAALGRRALKDLIESRAREGARLVSIIRERAEAIGRLVERLRTETPALLAAYESKLVERLQNALAGSGVSNPPIEETMTRVRQEVTLYGLRTDVAEELARLSTHLDELQRILGGKGPVGKRIDFLLQELNREANTLGSKAATIDLSSTAVQFKLLIEQIREQVQNLE